MPRTERAEKSRIPYVITPKEKELKMKQVWGEWYDLIGFRIADEEHLKGILEHDPPVQSLVRAGLHYLHLLLPHRHLLLRLRASTENLEQVRDKGEVLAGSVRFRASLSESITNVLSCWDKKLSDKQIGKRQWRLPKGWLRPPLLVSSQRRRSLWSSAQFEINHPDST